jgi:hypothetical protein
MEMQYPPVVLDHRQQGNEIHRQRGMEKRIVWQAF